MCFDWTMQTYQIFQCILSYLRIGLFYTIEVHTASCKRANELPNNPQEEKKPAFFHPPKKELIHFRTIHGAQQN